MAVPRGAKPNQNGRKVYSQTANAIRKRQELGLGEFADDYAAAADLSTPTPAETFPESVSSPGEFSTEQIGVVTAATIIAPEVPLAPHVEDQPNYHCENCKGSISLNDTECPVCEESLDWTGLT
jgi:hypothetical protein